MSPSQSKSLPVFQTLGCLAASALLILPSISPGATITDVRINEVDSDTFEVDALEFIELYDGGDGNTSLAGLVLVFWNGNNDKSYYAIDLNTATTNAKGYYVVGNPTVENVGITFGTNFLQNGTDAVGLYLGNETDFPNNTALTTANAVDMLVYGDTEFTSFLTSLTPAGVTTLTHVFETVTDSDQRAMDSMARVPDGGAGFNSSTYVRQAPTPGATNAPVNEISIALSELIIAETGATTSSIATITLDEAAPAGGLRVKLSNSDPTEASMPVSITVSAGQAVGTFTINAVNDLWPDGAQTVTIKATALGFLPGQKAITVNDDGDTDPGIIINEIYGEVDAFLGDANQDGASNADDEFVEIINNTEADLDLSGYQIKDAAAVSGLASTVHVFPAGTVIPNGCAIIVFGSGAILEDERLELFGGAFVQKASNTSISGLNLTDTGDLVSIQNPAGVEVAGHVFGDIMNQGSYSRSPDLTGNFAQASFTPGYFNSDGSTPFCPVPEPLMLSITPDPVTEGGADGTLTISVATNVPNNTTITLTSSDITEATVAPSVVMVSGTNSITTPVTFPQDNTGDGTIAVVITAKSNRHFTGTVSFDVEDDGDGQTTLVINEVDYDQTGIDTTEFIEVYDGGVGTQELNGFVLVAYNGGGGAITAVGDLSGKMTNSAGFYAYYFPKNSLQNDFEAVALWMGAEASAFTGTTPDTAPFGAVLVDAVVYEQINGNTTFSVLNYTGANLADHNNANSPSLSRRPDGTGDYELAPPTPNASNGGGGGGDAYATWAAGYPGIGAIDEDDDDDGLSSLMEYALGKNPFTSDPNPGLIPALAASGKLQASITKGTAAGADSSLIYTIELSTNLVSWNTADSNVITNDASTITVEYTGTATEIYMRLKVTR